MVGIIILNWNGWKDTIECLQSLKQCSGQFYITLVDNGSTDDSVNIISNYLKQTNWKYNIFKESQGLYYEPDNKECIIYQLNENYGFAKGNNKALKFISPFMPKWCLLLNNDTETTPDFLSNLLNFANENPKYEILTPLINYYFNKNLVWNAGGNLNWGFRKYNYSDCLSNRIRESKYIECSFVTGCALLFKTKLLDKEFKLFTEDFFHGEEDVDLSLRMKANGLHMACVLNSVIYHKVNRSTQTMNNTGKMFVYFLNRFINIKKHFGPLNYKIWKIIHIVLVFLYLLIKQKMSFKRTYIFCSLLSRESSDKESVTKDDFFKYIKRFDCREKCEK
ncbi:MAG: glycosyltransferase family 2 protein [Bacteroides sp.]|nr:glycosyltransferase family 2 protein [Bacteroides sp.]